MYSIPAFKMRVFRKIRNLILASSLRSALVDFSSDVMLSGLPVRPSFSAYIKYYTLKRRAEYGKERPFDRPVIRLIYDDAELEQLSG